jgi:hypothetical protein
MRSRDRYYSDSSSKTCDLDGLRLLLASILKGVVSARSNRTRLKDLMLIGRAGPGPNAR